MNWLLSRASICAGPPDSPCVAMSSGNVPVDVSMPTPCACSAAMSVCMGRRFICAVASKWYRPCPAATEASRKRAAVPALPHHTDALSLGGPPAAPVTAQVASPLSSTPNPSDCSARTNTSVSSLIWRLVNVETPSASALSSSTRFEMLLEPGMTTDADSGRSTVAIAFCCVSAMRPA